MKELNRNLKDNEEGEELKDISPEDESDEESNTAINNKEYQKMQNLENKIESYNKHSKSIPGKKSSKKCIKIFSCIIIIILAIIAGISLVKYLSKVPPPKVEKYNECQWFIDGKNYFEDLFQKLMAANNSIYITDWWLSPEVFLRRPVDITPYLEMVKNKIITYDQLENMTRLMDVLNYKAKQGVKIYILIYKEFSIALTLNSEHTENILTKLNENIKVTRYPSFKEAIWWSDHEKLVIIDNVIGYVGGLDLCWGRYDNNQHPIYEAPNPENIYEFPFIDYSNSRIKDFSNVENYYIESVPREHSTRMPWHDVHSRIIGAAVANISKHFIQRWNYANSEENHLRVLSSIKNESNSQDNEFNFDKKLTKMNTLKNRGLKEEIIMEEKNINDGENPQLQNEMKNDVFPEVKTDLDIDKNKTNKTEIYKKYFTEGIPPSSVHVLRSVSEWNAGVNQTERSILNEYYHLIRSAKHYIYIENQFFVSKSWNMKERENNEKCINDEVQNKIAYYIRKRIEKAYRRKENFKVYIFIPLLPGFSGSPEDSETIKIILKHTYASISRNYGLSMIERLEKRMGNEWKNYISFFSLRNHALVNNVPKTEIIYIHCKLMIIDDKTVLIGSANINDRSMLGDRDSEFAVIINEKQELENKKTGKKYIMNGDSNYNATNFAVEFRKALMAEHLGISQNDSILDDPVSNQLYSLFINRARNNTEIYHDLFACYPDDSFVSFQSLKEAQEIKKSEKAEDLLDKYNKLKGKIVGHIVEFPLLFLKDENLGTSLLSTENFIPEINFT